MLDPLRARRPARSCMELLHMPAISELGPVDTRMGPRPRRRWWLPLVILAGLTLPFWLTDLDRDLAARFFDPELPASPWVGENNALVLALYKATPLLGVGMGLLGILWVVVGFRRRDNRLRAWQGLALLLILTIGPGVIVNDVFKEHWGRPRPRQIIEFGGVRLHLPPLLPADNTAGTSFPSGHAAIAFAWLGVYSVLRRRAPGRARLALGFGLAAGALVGLVRMAMGGHFLSDVLWSGAIVWASSWLICDILLELPLREKDPSGVPLARTRRRLGAAGLVVFFLVLVQARHKALWLGLSADGGASAQRNFRLETPGGDVELLMETPQDGATVFVSGFVEGLTLLGGGIEVEQIRTSGRDGELGLRVLTRGLLDTAHGRIVVRLDPGAFDRVVVKTVDGCVRVASDPCVEGRDENASDCIPEALELRLDGSRGCR